MCQVKISIEDKKTCTFRSIREYGVLGSINVNSRQYNFTDLYQDIQQDSAILKDKSVDHVQLLFKHKDTEMVIDEGDYIEISDTNKLLFDGARAKYCVKKQDIILLNLHVVLTKTSEIESKGEDSKSEEPMTPRLFPVFPEITIGDLRRIKARLISDEGEALNQKSILELGRMFNQDHRLIKFGIIMIWEYHVEMENTDINDTVKVKNARKEPWKKTDILDKHNRTDWVKPPYSKIFES